jgi:glycosyltransferase involved in cell wall biosynthesis
MWPKLLWERKKILRHFSNDDIDLWFTYHSYYKAPDLLGPFAAGRLKVPYTIFQGIYSTKRRRRLKTRLGFHLNKKSLLAADHIFSNKRVDLLNLKRLRPDEKITYISPGLKPDEFIFDADARAKLRTQWGVGDDPVVLSAAMFRPGVKSKGLTWVIRTCGKLRRDGHDLWLVIAGDGKEKAALQKLAHEQLTDRVQFVGKLPRDEIYRFYSAGDLFVFPGINESLGMVYLEAQACGLPVVAFENAGVPEAVENGRTGILVPLYDGDLFADAISRLLVRKELRRKMGKAARSYVREIHDMNKNYRLLETMLQKLVQGDPKSQNGDRSLSSSLE